MKRLLEIIEDHSGGLSSSRVQMMLWTLGVLGVWMFISISTLSMMVIPESVLVLVLGTGSLKVIQRFGEKNEDKS